MFSQSYGVQPWLWRNWRTGISAAELIRDAGMGLGQAFNVCLVHDLLVVGGTWWVIGSLVEERIDHRAGHGFP